MVERRVREKVEMTREEEAEQGHLGSRTPGHLHRRQLSPDTTGTTGSSADTEIEIVQRDQE